MSEIPVFQVDFNELTAPNVVLLSKTDQRKDMHGRVVTLAEGMEVCVSDEDRDTFGNRDDLIAFGTAVRTAVDGWAGLPKWSCRIDERGIRHQSEIIASD